MTSELNELYQRELDKAILEIQAYESEADIWRTSGDIINSAGNLALHMAGNLQHFIGALLGGSDYVRDRDLEFNAKGVSRLEIISQLEKAKEALTQNLPQLSDTALVEPFPGKIPYDMNMGQFLLHLYGHLSYHLGQLNYHRRMIGS